MQQGRRKPIQRERAEGDMVVKWFELQYPDELLCHIPNELVRGCVQARIMVKAGLIPGMCDFVLFLPKGGHAGLCMEFKPTIRKGEPKPKEHPRQIAIIKHLNSRGYLAKIIYGFDAAKKFIDDYMKM